jgi:hypothetical protein
VKLIKLKLTSCSFLPDPRPACLSSPRRRLPRSCSPDSIRGTRGPEEKQKHNEKYIFQRLPSLIAHLVAQNAGFRKALQEVPLLRDHVRQLVHLRLEERDLLGRRDELAIVLVDVLLQLRVRVLGQGL